MGAIRYAETGSLFEVTTRTREGEMRMVPTGRMRLLILGVIGQALLKFDVKCHALVYLTNHYHMLLTVRDADQLAAFMGFVNGNITREVNRLQSRSGSMWSERYTPIPVTPQQAAQRLRLRYLLAHGVKERLVAKVRHWPGASSARHLMNGSRMRGIWVDRTAMNRAARLVGPPPNEGDFVTEHELVMEPLPCHEEMTVEERQAEVRATVADIETQYAEEGGGTLGVKAVLAIDPRTIPAYTKRSKRPQVHAYGKAVREQWRRKLRRVRAAHAEASRAFQSGEYDTVFPFGTFRPSGGFVAWPAEALADAA